MPYIKQDARDKMDCHIKGLAKFIINRPVYETAGLLNYAVTKLIVSLWSTHRNYHMGNSIVGALTCAMREFCRRHLDGYEDEKIHQNGDVQTFKFNANGN